MVSPILLPFLGSLRPSVGLLIPPGKMRGGHASHEAWPPFFHNVATMNQNLFRRCQELGKQLEYRTGLTEQVLAALPRTYREIRMPKRRGGFRTLSIPNRHLKEAQRALLRHVLQKLPVHPAAKGFRRRHSTLDHASLHAKKHFVVLLDIQDFFPSTSLGRVHRAFLRLGWPECHSALQNRPRIGA